MQDIEPPTSGGANTVRAADMNGDGDLDLVVGGNAELNIYLQQGRRKFLEVHPPLSLPHPGSVWDSAVVDLNGDGRADIALLTVSSPNLISIYYQKSEEGFPLIPDTNLGPRQEPSFNSSLAARDLDGDGSIDLITRGTTSGLLLFFQEEGRGFANDQGFLLDDPSGGTSINSVGGCAIDFDNDGLIDVVSGNADSQTLTIFYQKAPKVFGLRRAGVPGTIPDRIIPGIGSPTQFIAIDVDGDGDPDVVSPDFYSGTIKIFLGNH